MVYEWLQKIPEFMQLTWSDLGKGLIGAFMVGTLALGWVRSVRKATKAQIRAEDQRRQSETERERAEAQREIAELKSQHAQDLLKLREQTMEAQQSRTESEAEREKLATSHAALQRRLSDLESFDGKLWEQDTAAAPPAFVTATDRKTRFISFVNLKGGVGKTTLAANVGVSLARRNHRVLLVDLDFQSSLTRLCTATNEQLLDLIKKKKTAARLLDGTNGTVPIEDLSQRVSHPNLVAQTCDFIPADESLAEAELRAQARWLVTKTPDARFLFRRVFHCPQVLSNYDFVLFDCPPRLTTACINALGCSDFLLVPVLLEQGSVEALPRTLNWLTRLPHVSRARLLGVVANRVELYRGKPVSSQQTIYDYLPETLKRGGFHSKDVFLEIIKNNRALIEEAANRGKIAAAESGGADLFEGLTIAIEKGVRS
jgi:cellulose biosynthesis protein BcsQ